MLAFSGSGRRPGRPGPRCARGCVGFPLSQSRCPCSSDGLCPGGGVEELRFWALSRSPWSGLHVVTHGMRDKALAFQHQPPWAFGCWSPDPGTSPGPSTALGAGQPRAASPLVSGRVYGVPFLTNRGQALRACEPTVCALRSAGLPGGPASTGPTTYSLRSYSGNTSVSRAMRSTKRTNTKTDFFFTFSETLTEPN